MKLACWFLAYLLAACIAMDTDTADSEDTKPILVNSTNSDGTNWPEIMYFPDAQGNPRSGKILGSAYYIPASRDDVFYMLYTRKGPREGEYLKLGDADKLRSSTYNHSQPTIFVTHGYLSTILSETVLSIKDMYLGYHEVNVIAVDWSEIADSMYYFIAKKYTVPVGGLVAEFLHFLHESGGADLGNFHLIGHSLGAHVMGIAGKKIQSVRKVGRITGLDPAGPLYTLEPADIRLDREDAEFVDVIHTCGGVLGFYPPIGKVDFYPNGGVNGQPGCPFNPLCEGCCSHDRAWKFYAESVNSPNFTSLPCDSYVDFENKINCNAEQMAPMGDPAPNRIVGVYYLNTAASSPYALHLRRFGNSCFC